MAALGLIVSSAGCVCIAGALMLVSSSKGGGTGKFQALAFAPRRHGVHRALERTCVSVRKLSVLGYAVVAC